MGRDKQAAQRLDRAEADYQRFSKIESEAFASYRAASAAWQQATAATEEAYNCWTNRYREYMEILQKPAS
jgi:hypothetical protein